MFLIDSGNRIDAAALHSRFCRGGQSDSFLTFLTKVRLRIKKSDCRTFWFCRRAVGPCRTFIRLVGLFAQKVRLFARKSDFSRTFCSESRTFRSESRTFGPESRTFSSKVAHRWCRGSESRTFGPESRTFSSKSRTFVLL